MLHKISKYFYHKQIHRQIWRFAVPMILSNLSVPLLGMVDTAVVGHLDEAYHIGAVAVGAMIFGIVFWGFGFLRMSTTGITAQIYGQGNRVEIRLALVRALLVSICIAVLLLLLKNQIATLAFYLVDASERVESNARIYFDIRILSSPATLFNYVLLGWFLGMQNAKYAFVLMVFVNTINMLLDYIFVINLGAGAGGVAWASLIAEYCGLILGIYLVFKILRAYPGQWQWQGVFDKAKINALLLINKNIFIRTLCIMFTLAFFTAQGSRMGDTILAANALLVNFQTFMAYGLDGLAHAAEALVGKAIGSKDKTAFYGTIVITTFWAVIVSIGFSITYLLIGEYVLAMLTDIDSVKSVAIEYLPWVIVLPLVSVWSFVFDGVYIGAARVLEMRNIMLIATFGFFLPFWYAFQQFENHGLWFAFVIFMLARGIIMLGVFLHLDRNQKFVGKY